MTADDVAAYALGLPEAAADQPFGPGTYVFRIGGKIFAILSPDGEPPSVSLKCEPALALHLRERFPAVTAGYHLNKRHWNTVALDGTVPAEEIEEMVEHSYERVIAGLPAATRRRLLPPPS